MQEVVGDIVLVAGNGVDAGEIVARIGTVWTGTSHHVGVVVAAERQALPAERARDVQGHVVVAVVVVGYRAVVAKLRSERGDAGAAEGEGGAQCEAVLLVS